MIINKRPAEITRQFHHILDDHLRKLLAGEADDYLGIHQIAQLMHIHPTHLSNTVKAVTGQSPCDICNEKTIQIARDLLKQDNITIRDIAFRLSFEPSNFTKYFKKHTGQSPSVFRKAHQ